MTPSPNKNTKHQTNNTKKTTHTTTERALPNLWEAVRCQGSLAYRNKMGTPKPTASRGQVLSQVCKFMGLWFFLIVMWRKFCFTSSLSRRTSKEKSTCDSHSARMGPVAWNLNPLEPDGDVIYNTEDWCPVRCNTERKPALFIESTPYQIKEPTTRNFIQWHPNNLINSIIIIFY